MLRHIAPLQGRQYPFSLKRLFKPVGRNKWGLGLQSCNVKQDHRVCNIAILTPYSPPDLNLIRIIMQIPCDH